MNNEKGSQPTADKFTVIVYCQYMENYGAHTEPAGPAHWKFKGGDDVLVHNCTSIEQAMEEVSKREEYVWDNERSRSYVCHAERFEGQAVVDRNEKREFYEERGWTLDENIINL
jgi:hypothetical protein